MNFNNPTIIFNYLTDIRHTVGSDEVEGIIEFIFDYFIACILIFSWALFCKQRIMRIIHADYRNSFCFTFFFIKKMKSGAML